MIYIQSLDLSHALSLINTNTFVQAKRFASRVNYDWRSTPGILLVNRQCHREAIEILYQKHFTLNRGCNNHVMLGSFSKTFFQRIRHVTLNIDLDFDWENCYPDDSQHYRDDYPHGWWLSTTTLLGIVWDQRHSLRTLTINITGIRDHFERWSEIRTGFGNVTYVHRLLAPLQNLRGVSQVTMLENISTLNTHPREMTLVILSIFSELLKLGKDASAESLQQQLPQLPEWQTDSIVVPKQRIISFTEFIRWWSLAEEGFRFDKRELVCEVSFWPNYGDLEKAWAESSWRCLPYFPLRTERNVIERGHKKFSQDEWGTRLYFAEYDKKVALKEWAT